MKLCVALIVSVLVGVAVADVTMQQFRCMFPRVSTARATSFMAPMNDVMRRYGITTLNRIAMFLAQTGHETDQYNTFSEYVNADGTNAWCPRYTGGCRFRGRGAIQLTHRYNYEKAGRELGLPFVSNPDMVATLPHAFEVAGLFWKWNNLNAPSDSRDLNRATRIINGGYNGIEDRRRLYALAYRCLGASNPTPAPTPRPATGCRNSHTVVSGDTLSRISTRYNTTVQALMTANRLSSSVIRIGQVLCIP